jgi:predicted nicotinamide N-methyase
VHLSHCSEPVTIKQNPTALKPGAKIRVGAAVWDGAYVLASYLDAQPPGTFTGLRCVELGCGCGLLGLVLARLGGAAVYLTDKPQLLTGPRVNAAKNKLLAAQPPPAAGAQQQQQQQQQQPSAAVVQVCALDWEDQQTMAQSVAAIRAQGRVDVIVASDCIYPGALYGAAAAAARKLWHPHPELHAAWQSVRVS